MTGDSSGLSERRKIIIRARAHETLGAPIFAQRIPYRAQRDTTTMDIFPHYALRLRYKGEDAVYKPLREIHLDGGFAVHSLNLPEHAYKRWGEADFVVVS